MSKDEDLENEEDIEEAEDEEIEEDSDELEIINDEQFQTFFQPDVEASSPVLEDIAEGSQDEGLSGLVPVSEEVRDEDEKKDTGYSIGGYEKNEVEKYDSREDPTLGNIDMMNVGRERAPLTRDMNFANPESGRVDSENEIEQRYTAPTRVDVEKVGRKRSSPLDRGIEVKKYEQESR